MAADSKRGLAGLRHRAEELGGGFEAGPASDGGWRVTAVLPVDRGTRPGTVS